MRASLAPNGRPVAARSHATGRLRARVRPATADPDAPSTSGRVPGLPEYAPTLEPMSPGFLRSDLPPTEPWVRPQAPTFTPPSVAASGTLRPDAEWYPAWMRYRSREDNSSFWGDKISRCSLDIPRAEKRWTLFSTFWYLFMELKYVGTPPALRFLWYLTWRAIRERLYEAHKTIVLWQAKIDAGLATRALGGTPSGFSRAMALRRLHWRNSLLGELLYLVNVAKTGRVHMLPPVRRPLERPTFFFVF